MAYTTLPTQSAGQVASASGWANLVKANFENQFHVKKMKAVDETVPTSTTLQNDDDFFFPVAINEKWGVEIHLKVNTSTAADLKWNWTVPAGTARDHTWSYGNPAANPDWAGTGDGAIAAGGSGVEAVHIIAYFLVSGTAGTVQFQWAQQASSGSTILKAGSHMIANRFE